MSAPVFPPLFSGRDAAGKGDPATVAARAAADGCDAGLVVYDLGADRLRAAIVFAPEMPLAEAMIVLPVCGVGFQNALGALAPPEVAVHLGWDGAIRVNGGHCGELAALGPGAAEGGVPGWLVIALDLQLWPASDETGLTPETTALYAEGCAEVDAVALLEAWVRHTLAVLNGWLDGGARNLHREWSGLLHGPGSDVEVLGQAGHFLGADAEFAMLLKQGNDTARLPLTRLLRKIP